MRPVIPPASRRAAPNSPQGAHLGAPADPIQLHAEAHNALAMALHYLRQPAAVNLPGATRKAVQALAALRRLDGLARGVAAELLACPDARDVKKGVHHG